MIERNPYMTALGSIALGLLVLGAIGLMLQGAALAMWGFVLGGAAGLLWLAVAAIIWNARHPSDVAAPAEHPLAERTDTVD